VCPQTPFLDQEDLDLFDPTEPRNPESQQVLEELESAAEKPKLAAEPSISEEVPKPFNDILDLQVDASKSNLDTGLEFSLEDLERPPTPVKPTKTDLEAIQESWVSTPKTAPSDEDLLEL
jgi:hypothetical protein